MKKGLLLVAVTILVAKSGIFADEPASKVHPGKSIYEKKGCATCHGLDLKGKKALADSFKVKPAKLNLTLLAGKKIEDIAATISKGRGKMPAYGKDNKATPQEINEMASYILSTTVKIDEKAPIKK